MGISTIHLLLFAGVAVLLFGRGKISELMGDFGKGLKSFKNELSDDGAAGAASKKERFALSGSTTLTDEKVR